MLAKVATKILKHVDCVTIVSNLKEAILKFSDNF